MIMANCNSILDGLGGVEVNSLTALLETTSTRDINDPNFNEPKLIKQSPYFDIDGLIKHLKNMKNFFTLISPIIKSVSMLAV